MDGLSLPPGAVLMIGEAETLWRHGQETVPQPWRPCRNCGKATNQINSLMGERSVKYCGRPVGSMMVADWVSMPRL